MSLIKEIVRQHPENVGVLFNKYQIPGGVTPRNLARAIRTRGNAFVAELVAMMKTPNASNFDFYIVDADMDSFDGGETVVEFFDGAPEEMDFASGRKERRKAKRVKRKEKKAAKKAAKKSNQATEYAETADWSDEGERTTIADKIGTGLGIVGQMAEIGGGIASAFSNRGNDAEEYEDEPASNQRTSAAQAATGESGMKKYMPYIIGGVVLLFLIVGLFFILKKKK